MASPGRATELTEAHRLAQAAVGRRALAAMLAVWGLLDPNDIDGSIDRWLSAAIPIVQRFRAQSSTLAGNYHQAFRAAELGTATPAASLVLAGPAAEARLATSLTISGPARIRRETARTGTFERAARIARNETAREVYRHVLNAGRETLTQTVAADTSAVGWARSTSGNPCHFCAMIASRGPVFDKDSARFETHAGCNCSAEPVYRDDQPWPAGADRYRDLWRDATRLGADEGVDTTVMFRRLIEGRASATA